MTHNFSVVSTVYGPQLWEGSQQPPFKNEVPVSVLEKSIRARRWASWSSWRGALFGGDVTVLAAAAGDWGSVAGLVSIVSSPEVFAVAVGEAVVDAEVSATP